MNKELIEKALNDLYCIIGNRCQDTIGVKKKSFSRTDLFEVGGFHHQFVCYFYL